ncbi:hypothetical protein [Caballeronia sp. LZ034LL]|uniref:hypothetical protein n=1 Tax=Caballeronia sp. LZ034LL TaxID=3038567 RepID=UPI002856E65F|nr:hypothetical protein [Caballeronia sp. LZ034LL]MDR5838496.1 hypothetical protein [Caballeronia sp. LZ034LL]
MRRPHRAGRAPGAARQLGEKVLEDHDDLDGATQTTAGGLIRLASVIATLARESAIDTRFGAKLLKRLDKEARRVTQSGATMDDAEQAALLGALGELDLVLRQRDAASLVEANARLRDTEAAASGKKRKGKKDDKAAPSTNDDTA